MSESPGFIREGDVWRALAKWRAERRRFVLATVTETRGFTPRKAGAHMLIGASGEQVGTVGGGAIELEVCRTAAELMRRGGTAEVRRHLTQELGMCCGGAMTVFLEVVERAPRLYVFGAGYIAKPLAAIAAGCGFEVTIADARVAWATPERFPTSTLCVRPADEAVHDLALDPSDYAVVMTHDHAVDQRVVEALLRRPLRFVGMIGSIPKQRKFALRLRARGFATAAIARLHTPLGNPIGAQTPEEIAVSVMAELIAARRGASSGASAASPEPQGATADAAAGAADPASEALSRSSE
ncbi:MAG: xanthine dehydrogenase accessory protein XdhC [Candidatus Eiseniibacteriota bacterium]